VAAEQLIITPPLAANADVVVVGSGTAGASAAIAAARNGASVLLIEKQGFMGGTSTAVLDTFYGFYTPGSDPRKIAGGISDDVVAGLRQLGPVLERPNTYGAGTGVTYNSEHLKLVWERLASEAGVRVMLHSYLQDVSARDGHVEELLLATKAGLVRVAGRLFVDASGDADLAHHAGFGYELAGANDPAQTLTTTFRMVNVDIAARKSISTAEMPVVDVRICDIGSTAGRAVTVGCGPRLISASSPSTSSSTTTGVSGSASPARMSTACSAMAIARMLRS